MLEYAVSAAAEKKADDITVLDLKGFSTITDHFIICSGDSERQVKAIAERVEEKLSEQGYRLRHIEGKEQGQWVLMDYVDVVIHVFIKEKREYYNLEHLWREAPRLLEDMIEKKLHTADITNDIE